MPVVRTATTKRPSALCMSRRSVLLDELEFGAKTGRNDGSVSDSASTRCAHGRSGSSASASASCSASALSVMSCEVAP